MERESFDFGRVIADAEEMEFTGPRLVDEPLSENALSTPRTPRFTLLSDVELEHMPEPVWLVENLAFEAQLIALVGKFGTFKTFLLLDIALCIALGLDWNGRRVTQGPVVYICAEGATGLKRRVGAWKAACQFAGSAPIYFLPTRCDVADPRDVASLLLAITAKLPPGNPPRALFVDTVARNMGGDENSGEDMKAFVAGCDRLREATGAAVFLAHHMGWVEKRSRGSSVLPAAVDTEIQIDREDDTVTLTNTKQKEAAEFAAITLEAFQIAGSLVFRGLVPHASRLSEKECVALTALLRGTKLTAKTWEEESGLAHGTFARARTRLLDLSYVRHEGTKYVATDAGELASKVPGYHGGTIELPNTLASEGTKVPPYIDTVVLGTSPGQRGDETVPIKQLELLGLLEQFAHKRGAVA